MMKTVDLGFSALIDGKWEKGTQELISSNPGRYDEIVAVFSEANADQVRRAWTSARSVQKSWAKTPAPVRAEVILNFGKLVEKNKEALSQTVCREIGKPIKEARGSVQEVIDTCNFFVSEGRRLYGQTIPSEMPDKECFTYRRPLGVFGFITACNFPAAVPAWYFVPALVAGNTCVWKPSEEAPLTSYYLTELLLHAGVPKGVFNVVFGGASTGSELIKGVEEGAFDKIGFTGSTQIGKKIGEVCGRNLIVPCLELGGKNPLVICDDSDLELAVEGALFSGLATAGQRCTSLGNLIVSKKILDAFMQKFIPAIKSIKIGNPQNESNFYGPLISEKYLNSHMRNIETLLASHHELPLGKGGRIGFESNWNNFFGDEKKGFYASPTVVLGVKENDEIYATETFGPLFNVMTFEDFDEAIHLANAHGYGLSSAIYSRDPQKIYKFKSEISAGMTSINNSTTGAEAHLPFGGNGKSGNGGRQSGIWVIDQFTKWHAVNWDLSGKLQKAQMDTGYIKADLSYGF